MSNVLDEIEKCVGCSSCAQRCIKKCITMKPDNEGFLFPNIDSSGCTNCGICKNVCPVSDNNPENRANTSYSDKAESSNVFACWNNSDEIRFKSSSGALFSSFSENIIKKGGVVFGAAFDDKFLVCHTSVNDINDLDSLRGSKYVQSDIGNSYSKAEELLQASNSVLFSGTPCQIAGLKAFLGKEYEKLLTIDIVCHGVPSAKIWLMYLDYMKDIYKSDITQISFRHKLDGWQKSYMKIDFDNGKTYLEKVYKETYFIGYGKSIFNRKSCLKCNFRLQNTNADITLGDFWGVEKLNDIDVSDNKGVSLLIVNTPKGNAALSEIRSDIHIHKRTLTEAVKGNPRLITSCGMPEARKRFFDSVESGNSFRELKHKYMNNSGLIYRIKVIAKNILGGKLIKTFNKFSHR